MLRIGFNVLLIAIFWVGSAGAALADRGKGETTARQGVVKCGGNNFLRLGGTEIQFASYTLRNFDATQPIVVDRMRFFDANGNVLFDTAGGALPLAENGVLGPANSTLNPNQTLQESGVKVTVGLRKGGASWDKAKKGGLKVADVGEAIEGADIVMILLPDEHHAQVYKEQVEPNIKKGASLAFAHGFNIHYGLIQPREDLDVWMVAPKAPGHTVRSTYAAGGGVPMLIAVHRDPSKKARDVALSYAAAIGGGKAGIIETNFKEETETDLFGEQTVLCGGCVELVKAGFDTLVEAGYAPEMAYFECLHELKLIVDLMYEGGIGTMNYSISNNAEYGEYVTGPKIIDEGTRKRMKEILGRIQSGEYAKEFVLENRAGAPTLLSQRRMTTDHPTEQVGEKLPEMKPRIKKNKLVDQTRN